MGAPDPEAYKSHSGGIIETLEDLLEKAKDELASSRKKETNDKHSFEMLEQSLTDEIKFANKDMDETKKSLAGAKQDHAVAEGDLAVTAKELANDEDTAKDLHQNCMDKAQDFEAEVKSRSEELKALADAKNTIKEATDGAEQVQYGEIQEPSSFLQLSKLVNGADLANFEAVRFVRNLARQQHSP